MAGGGWIGSLCSSTFSAAVPGVVFVPWPLPPLQLSQPPLCAPQAEYVREGIDWRYIDFVDNQEVLDLVEGRMGLLDLLDEQCRFPMVCRVSGAIRGVAFKMAGWSASDP